MSAEKLKPNQVRVSGASDDLIEIEGALSGEFNVYDESSSLAFPDGTLLTIEYGKSGMWSVHVVVLGRGTSVKHTPATSAEDDNYSDVVVLTMLGPPKWCVRGDLTNETIRGGA